MIDITAAIRKYALISDIVSIYILFKNLAINENYEIQHIHYLIVIM